MGIIQKMDFLILNWLQKHLRGKTLDILMPMITALGNGGFLFALLTIGLLCTRRWRREGMAVGTSLLLCLLAGNLFLKPLVGRIRPYDLVEGFQLLIKPLADYSFPSGHTCASFASAFAIYKCKEVFLKKWRTAAMVLATLIALSRLYVGVHYPTDVLGGLIVGLFSGWAGWKIEELIMKKRAEKKKSADNK